MIVADRRIAGGDVALIDRLAAVAAALPAGLAAIQIRAPELDGGVLVGLVRAVIAAARPHGTLVVVNERLDVALATGADGVQLPERGLTVGDARAVAAACGRALLIGASRHDAGGVAAAAAAGADWIVVGPVWPTPSKDGVLPPLGEVGLAALCAAAGATPVIAIGGIDGEARMQAARTAGARGGAVIRAVIAAADPVAAARRLVGLGA